MDPPQILGQPEEDPKALLLHVSYPEAYPDVAPDLDITFDEDSTSTALLSLPEDKPALLAALTETIEENLGMAMVFTITSMLKESAENLMHERATKKDQEREATLRQEEEKEMEKFRGELVTKERFIEWRKKFMEEREAAKKKAVEDEEAEGKRGQKKNPTAEEKKLTGKELWERGLAGNVDDDEEEEGIDIAKLKLEK